MRNTTLTLVAAGSLTSIALTPAFAVGLECSDYPNNPDRCPIYGVYGNSAAQPYAQVSPRQIRHAQAYQVHHHYR